ncbi:MAG: ATP-binding protein [Acetatifactor sp.]|nr:ATP-binding protein [Acetatifactor sp.]
MSDLYYLIIDGTDIAMQAAWAILLCLFYHHFFRLKFYPDSRCMIFLPGAVWIGIKRILDIFIVISLTSPKDNVKSLFKQLLIYVILLLLSFFFYQGNKKQLTLITMLSVAVSEIGRFLSFSLSVFWNRAYDLCNRWFDRNMSEADVRRYLSLLEGMAIVQQFSYAVIFIVIIYCTFRYVRKIYRIRELPLHRTEFLFLMFPCASSFLLCTLLRTIMFTTLENAIPKTFYESFPLLIGIVPLLLVICLFSMLYSIKLYQEMLLLNEERNRRAVLEKQVVSMEEHARELERIYSGVRSMKHDMKNQLAVLENLIGRQSGREEFNGYLEQLGLTLGQLDVPFQTGSTVVDSLLFMKYHEVSEKLPEIRFDADDLIFPKGCGIQSTDLCIILGNALDNAIEACLKPGAAEGQESPFIRLYSRCQQNMLLLTVENSFRGELKISQGSVFPVTTKADSDAHGIGMRNIRAAAERYRGGMSWEAAENRFTLTVMLNYEHEA